MLHLDLEVVDLSEMGQTIAATAEDLTVASSNKRLRAADDDDQKDGDDSESDDNDDDGKDDDDGAVLGGIGRFWCGSQWRAGWLVAIGALFSPKHGHRGKSSFFHQIIFYKLSEIAKQINRILPVRGILGCCSRGSRGGPPGDPRGPR